MSAAEYIIETEYSSTLINKYNYDNYNNPKKKLAILI